MGRVDVGCEPFLPDAAFRTNACYHRKLDPISYVGVSIEREPDNLDPCTPDDLFFCLRAVSKL